MASLGLRGKPSFAEPKQLKIGLALPVLLLSVCPAVSVVPLPSTWQELQLPLPLKSTKPAISSAVRVTGGAPSTPPLPAPARKKSNFELNGLISGERSRNERDCPQ